MFYLILSILKKKEYRVSFNENFENVIESCSNIKRVGQKGTWITSGLKKSFNKLHEMGHAHSVEVWYQNVIIGGLYGLDLGNVFCGENGELCWIDTGIDQYPAWRQSRFNKKWKNSLNKFLNWEKDNKVLTVEELDLFAALR